MARVSNKFQFDDFAQAVPTGAVNGSNASFTLPSSPESPAAVILFLDGIMIRQTTDYTISGTAITMVAAPAAGQDLAAFYIKAN